MRSLEELSEQANRASVNLLFTDAEMALTFLDLACGSRNKDLRERRINEAAKAYSFIQSRIHAVTLTASEAEALHEKMLLLKMRLSLR